MFNLNNNKKYLSEHPLNNKGWIYVGPFYSYKTAYDYANYHFPGSDYIKQSELGRAKIKHLDYY